LTDCGKLIRYLTEEEYPRFRNYESKFFSSSRLMFYAASAAYRLHLREVVTAGFPSDLSRAMNRWKKTSWIFAVDHGITR